jgi:hypothetical protein
MGLKEDGQAFLNRILQHVAADQRETLATSLSAHAGLVEALGKDAAAVAGVQSEHDRLTGWYNTNKAALERAKTILDAHSAGRLQEVLDDLEDPEPTTADPLGLGGGRRTRAAAPVAGLDEKTVQERIAAAVAGVEAQGLTLINKMTKIGLGHFKEFNEVLDTDELTDFAVKNNLRLDLAYGEFVKEKRGAVAKTVADKALAEAIEQGRKEGRAEALNRSVPVPAGSASGTTLNGLTTEGKVDASLPALRQALAEASTATGVL